MAFTEFLFDRQAIQERAEQARANLKAKRGLSDALGFAIDVIWDRLNRDPMNYRSYGPYWWTVKDVLQRHGKEIGQNSHEMVRSVYSFEDDYESLIAAETFRDWYLDTQFKGTNQFLLDRETGETYTLFDSDMEIPLI